MTEPAAVPPVTATVTEIDIDRERAVTLAFDDGVVHTFDLAELREACPCATCRSRREQDQPVVGAGSVARLAGAELVGAWGISLRWADGHDTGIYPWDALHRWARTAEGVADGGVAGEGVAGGDAAGGPAAGRIG